MNWLDALSAQVAAQGPTVRVVVAEAAGSAPRETGAAMLVWRSARAGLRTSGTIGGGALEHAAIAEAGAMLNSDPALWTRRLLSAPLGPKLGQCCGGHVRLLLERFADDERRAEEMSGASAGGARLFVRSTFAGARPLLLKDRQMLKRVAPPKPVAHAAEAMLSGERAAAPQFFRRVAGQDWLIEPIAVERDRLYLYGAGHVGRAIIRAFHELPFEIYWVDTAEDRFPHRAEVGPDGPLSAAARVINPDPAAIAASAPAGALHLVLTYSHAIDLAICHALLKRADFAWLGLIGSTTKRARFRKRLTEAGVPAATLDRLVCPIGIDALSGKAPAVIAISVAAQLLQWRRGVVEARRDAETDGQPVRQDDAPEARTGERSA